MNTIVIIYKAKDYQIKQKIMHNHHFNLSLHEHDQPKTLLAVQLIQPSKHQNNPCFYQNNMINHQNNKNKIPKLNYKSKSTRLS